MTHVAIAKGFRFAGIHAGIKVQRPDLALIASDLPAQAAGVVTQNACRAACVRRTESLLPAAGVRAIVINSGNANCLSGENEVANDRRMAESVASVLGVSANAVLTASTGSIGIPLPMARIESAVAPLVGALQADVREAARAILTTDRVIKVASRVLDLADGAITLTALAKGSGMIHPNMATMLAFICTDAVCSADQLEVIVRETSEATFNQVTVDRDTSTNDMAVMLANGASGVTVDADTTPFRDAVSEICRDLARAMAADGEGATRLVSLRVSGAPSQVAARDLARSAVASNLFKASIFGDRSGWGRCLAAIGARAAAINVVLDPRQISVTVDGITEVRDGYPTGDSAMLGGPEVVIEVALGPGGHDAWAWGCDLSYDYVSINAVSKAEPLTTHSPGLKRRLLVEALSYIRHFRGRLAVIKYGGAAMLRDDLKDAFAEDLVLLRAVGLRPVVVHGGGPEISRTLERLGQPTRFIDGIRVTDAGSMKVVEMVLTGSVNTDVVTRIEKQGGSAIGLSGKDGSLLRAKKLLREGTDYGQVGEVERVNTQVITMLVEGGYIPVISPVGVDRQGATYNVNADDVAAEVAITLGAEKLLYLTDVPGLLNGDEIISETTPEQLAQLIADKVVTGGMLPKVKALLRAVDGGVTSAHIIDGRVAHNLLAELFTDRGVGTWITRDHWDTRMRGEE